MHLSQRDFILVRYLLEKVSNSKQYESNIALTSANFRVMTETGDDNKEALPTWLSQAADRIVAHMNSDHSNSIVSTLHAQFGIKDPAARMDTLKVDGYYILSLIHI